MKWYGRFNVIFISFAYYSGSIKSEDDCVNVCKSVIHQAFQDYSYVESYLDNENRESFNVWKNSHKYEEKSKVAVGCGLLELVGFMNRVNAQKPCLLHIDEFDHICDNALRCSVNCKTLKEIVRFYSQMLALVTKHTSNCYCVLTGISRISCVDSSSLNNVSYIDFLNNHKFAKYYGITMDEFENLMTRPTTLDEVSQQAELAKEWYNGYNYKSLPYHF